ncbi:MAG TPA: FlgD immunoglobulin-like domain containing protein [Candidatus Limnocylindria bacterium]|nr:FlgD immunoglobulin-like domain containing protein [Candidatus Limnocylindria bacterium]
MSISHVRRWIFLAAVLLAGGSSLALTVEADPIGRALDDALSDIGSGRTGILYDRVLPLSKLERFAGGESSPAADLATWRQIYHELRRAAAETTNLPELDRFLKDAASQPGTVPLAVINYRYERIRPDAIARGTLVVRDGRLTRGLGEPFEERRVFAISPLQSRTFQGGDVTFHLDRSRYLSNDATRAVRVEVDLGDGLDYRRVSLDERIRARYAGEGRKTIRVRVTLADGTALHASSSFEVAAMGTPVPDDTLHVTATIPYQGQTAAGAAYVYLAPGHSALTNPIIIVEGFDLDNSMDWDELYAQLNQENLLENLRTAGFDAVVLDFQDATDYIQRNAFVVTALIEQVQSAFPPQASLAVIGASMGGLCSRYALAYLESQSIPHRVRTLISFDVPHLGGDIPLGIQYWVDFFSGQSAEAAFLLERLNTPAARQMLVYHLTDPPSTTGTADPLRATLLADLAAVGDYPSLPRLVAVANGSGTRINQGFLAGDQIIDYEYSSFLADVTGNVWAVPDQASRTIFEGRLRILFSTTTQNVTVSGTQPYDGAPGGWRSSMAQMDATPAPFGDIVALHPNHCFVPTTSALALATTDLFYDVAGDPNLLALSPFDAVYHPAGNQEHVTVTPENAAWFTSEIGQGVVSAPHPAVTSTSALTIGSGRPNPFHSSTQIGFTLSRAGFSTVRVFSIDGREVRGLHHGPISLGVHAVDWDGNDDRGHAVPAGIYFIRLAAPDGARTTRVVKLD